MSLAEYLAKNYLTADNPSGNSTTDLSTRPKKKRKKTKHTAQDQQEPTGLIIADDDDPLTLRSSSFTKSTGRNDPDEENPHIVTGPNPSAEFRKSKKSAWKRVGEASKNSEQAEADAILASAAAEAREKVQADEGGDAPALVSGGEDEDEDEVGGGPRMESGAKAGLQTAAQTAEMVKAMERKKKKEAAKNKEKGKSGEEETIYRDASGRIINVAMKRAEARRIADEEAAKEVAAKEALKGDVQRKEREKRKEELEEAKVMPLARGVDDEELNEKLKARERWNDPAAEFLTSTSTAPATAGAGGRSTAALKPVYKGAAPPNRYGIKPGYRWDGVDRANGFESEWFGARNKKERIGALEYAWQMDE